MDYNYSREKIKVAGKVAGMVRQEMARRIVGQSDLVNGLLLGLIAKGHILVEGVPGLAKTLAVKTLADLSACILIWACRRVYSCTR